LDNNDFNYAIEKLINYGRPHSTIGILMRMLRQKEIINTNLCVKALIQGITSTEETNIIDSNGIVKLISYLENDSSVNQSDLFKIEWGYLRLLVHYPGAYPNYLAFQLASDPKFFCEIIQSIYIPKNEVRKEPPTKAQQQIAENAWHLLYHWKTPPGLQKDGSFSESAFSDWIKNVEEICKKSGHLDIAYDHIGKVLAYSPPDNDGFWINKTIAEFLNRKDTDIVRKGYISGLYNSRGVIQESIDDLGKDDKKLAEGYEKKANELDENGFYIFSESIRGLEKQYDLEAVKMPYIIDELD